MYDKNHVLTRTGAEQVIRGGGSVLVGGRIFSRVEDLPSESDFAKGDPAREADARQRLEKQRDEAQRQLDTLGQAPAPAVEEAQPPLAPAHVGRGRRQ